MVARHGIVEALEPPVVWPVAGRHLLDRRAGAHRGSTVLVTVDIGANDLSRCIDRANGVIDLACVGTAFTEAPSNLARILAGLRAAAPGCRSWA
jgi:hypothetical protein